MFISDNIDDKTNKTINQVVPVFVLSNKINHHNMKAEGRDTKDETLTDKQSVSLGVLTKEERREGKVTNKLEPEYLSSSVPITMKTPGFMLVLLNISKLMEI